MISRCRTQDFVETWNHFWFRDCPPHSLAVLRILFGTFLLLYWGIQIFQVPLRYSHQGLLLPWITPDHWLGLVFTPPPVWMAYIIFAVFLTSLVTFTIGFRVQMSALLVTILYSYYWILTLFHFGTSFDRLFMFLLVIFIFAGSGATYSVDARLKHGSWIAWEPICILPIRLIAVQITATYFGVGAQKIVLDAWQSGEVLAWGFVGRWTTAPGFAIARMNIPLWVYDWMVEAIKAWEVVMPFALWSRKFRWWAFATGAFFHIFIAVFLSIWWFLPLIPAYIVFFTPDEVQRFLLSLSRRQRK